VTAVIDYGNPDGPLANATLRAYRRARRTDRTRGFDARVEARPMGDLPPVVDLLVLDPADAPAPTGAEVRAVLHVAPTAAPAEIERRLEALVADGSVGFAPPAPRRIVVHRGVEPLIERASIGDPA
jgi:hypothetical protein